MGLWEATQVTGPRGVSTGRRGPGGDRGSCRKATPPQQQTAELLPGEAVASALFQTQAEGELPQTPQVPQQCREVPLGIVPLSHWQEGAESPPHPRPSRQACSWPVSRVALMARGQASPGFCHGYCNLFTSVYTLNSVVK